MKINFALFSIAKQNIRKKKQIYKEIDRWNIFLIELLTFFDHAWDLFTCVLTLKMIRIMFWWNGNWCTFTKGWYCIVKSSFVSLRIDQRFWWQQKLRHSSLSWIILIRENKSTVYVTIYMSAVTFAVIIIRFNLVMNIFLVDKSWAPWAWEQEIKNYCFFFF